MKAINTLMAMIRCRAFVDGPCDTEFEPTSKNSGLELEYGFLVMSFATGSVFPSYAEVALLLERKKWLPSMAIL